MVEESGHRGGAGRALLLWCRASACRALACSAVAASGCAQVLGIPSDPVLAPAAVETPSASDAGTGGSPGVTTVPSVTPVANDPSTAGAAGASGRDGVLPTDGVGGVVTPADAGLPPELGPVTSVGADAGPAPVVDAGPPPPVCPVPPERVALDIIFAVDNSGSMAEECTAFEQALPRFVERLSSAGVDHSIILVSRHRRDARGSSEEADTSVCIAAPVSGLAACPSESPALGARFFHHSIKLDAADSFERLLESLVEPDAFDLNVAGWSEWLRPAARKIFIEITDADSDMSASDFSAALQAASPENFGRAAPSFVFHSVVGVEQAAAGAYTPDEPIVVETCNAVGSSIDGAGTEYQALSRATGGLRLSICPPEALAASLDVLAEDTLARSVVACP